MLTIEIFRNEVGLNVKEFCNKLRIHKSTYYNLLKGDTSVSDILLDRIGRCFSMPYMKDLYLLDRLYHAQMRIYRFKFPDSIPIEVQELMYQHHPIFESKYNRLIIYNQGDYDNAG
jgi:hypothetical protein